MEKFDIFYCRSKILTTNDNIDCFEKDINNYVIRFIFFAIKYIISAVNPHNVPYLVL